MATEFEIVLEKANEIKNNTEKVYNGGQLSVVSNANCLKGEISNTEVYIKDISPIPHNIGIKLSSEDAKLYRSGKNVLPFPYNGTKVARGITFIDNGDGSLTLNGTNDGSAGSVFYFMHSGSLTLSAGKYTQAILGDEGCTIMGITVDNKYISFKSTSASNLTQPTTFRHFYVQTPVGATYDNVTIYPMLEKGTTATEYEAPVIPIEYSINTDGTANVPSLYPSTRLYTDTGDITITANYIKDINKTFDAIKTNVALSGGE